MVQDVDGNLRILLFELPDLPNLQRESQTGVVELVQIWRVVRHSISMCVRSCGYGPGRCIGSIGHHLCFEHSRSLFVFQ